MRETRDSKKKGEVIWKFQSDIFNACEIFNVKKISFFVGMSLEHFVFKNKLRFYLYQHHFHCLISGRQRQKNGNSEREKQRAELILKT